MSYIRCVVCGKNVPCAFDENPLTKLAKHMSECKGPDIVSHCGRCGSTIVTAAGYDPDKRMEEHLAICMTTDILDERQKTHGDFSENARISQKLKTIFRTNAIHSDIQLEALDMIALKLSRILSGQANHKDHWTDIAGYARLVEKTL